MEGKIYSPEKGKFVSIKTKHGQKVLQNYNEHRVGGDKHKNCAYCKIVNPQTGKLVSTYGQTGGRVIRDYVNQKGGGLLDYKFYHIGNKIQTDELGLPVKKFTITKLERRYWYREHSTSMKWTIENVNQFVPGIYGYDPRNDRIKFWKIPRDSFLKHHKIKEWFKRISFEIGGTLISNGTNRNRNRNFPYPIFKIRNGPGYHNPRLTYTIPEFYRRVVMPVGQEQQEAVAEDAAANERVVEANERAVAAANNRTAAANSRAAAAAAANERVVEAKEQLNAAVTVAAAANKRAEEAAAVAAVQLTDEARLAAAEAKTRARRARADRAVAAAKKRAEEARLAAMRAAAGEEVNNNTSCFDVYMGEKTTKQNYETTSNTAEKDLIFYVNFHITTYCAKLNIEMKLLDKKRISSTDDYIYNIFYECNTNELKYGIQNSNLDTTGNIYYRSIVNSTIGGYTIIPKWLLKFSKYITISGEQIPIFKPPTRGDSDYDTWYTGTRIYNLVKTEQKKRLVSNNFFYMTPLFNGGIITRKEHSDMVLGSIHCNHLDDIYEFSTRINKH